MAVTATATVATIVGASPTTGPLTVGAAAPAPAPSMAASVPSLPAVTEHPVDAAVLAAAASTTGGESRSMTQTVQLTIVGGPLELATTEATVALERVSDRDWVGVLPPVRVVDARGTHEGWDVRWSVVTVETDAGPVAGNRLRLAPSPPAVVAGLAEGLEAGSPGPARPHGRTLFSADPGSGGGTYEAGAAVSLRLPASIDATSVVVHLGFSLAP